ncbi:response regulator transcription factor [Mucilaginibacter sp. HMF5004]|uniref:response regulator transcription factor n=1 Tax=Mucilaginibacter rivuli TaxID=2857527 RepID=UPI001C5FEE9D|nr:response regulator transcription factor [Mucilaginibacter rivuli]MBW4890557.1 response regulator transcription factor [Mucilaginibacter rivuli]
MAAAKKIFIVDDHQMVIDGLSLLINSIPGFEIAGVSNDPEKALDMLKAIPVDIVLTDVSMPGMSGVELTRYLRKNHPDIKVLALSMFGDSMIVSEMIDAGVSGFILKNTGTQELEEALKKIAAGGDYFTADITKQLVKAYKDNQEGNHLTDREIEIIRMIEREFSNKQIAALLFISERTIETHRKNIFRKTNTQTVVGLLKYAYERKII